MKGCAEGAVPYDTDIDVSGYEYVLYYGISRVLLKRAEGFKVDEADCCEAFFFGKEGQCHIFRDDTGLRATVISDYEGKEVKSIVKEYELAGCFKGDVSRVKVKEYLKTDEDGQIFVAGKRLLELC